MDVKTSAASLSVLSNSTLVIIKFGVGLSSGSVSVIAEGIHSTMDLLAAGIAFFSVRESGKPADNRHQYGHGKIENVSGTVEALLIFVAAVWIIWEAAADLMHPEPKGLVLPGVVVMGVSMIVNHFISRHLYRVAKATDSVALEADALHLKTDVLTSFGVFAGLVAIQLTGFAWLDPLVALLVAALIIKAAFELTREAFFPLLDTGLPPEEEAIVRQVIGLHQQYFVDYHALRTRKAGNQRYIDMHLVVPKDAHVDRVHEFCHHVEEEVEDRLPNVQVMMHVEPCEDQCENCNQNCDKTPVPEEGITEN